MSDPSRISPPPTDGPREAAQFIPVRFSLRSLLTATTLLAIGLALVSLLPVPFSQLAVGALWLLASGWLVTGLFFGNADQRAFCIGAGLVFSSMWTRIGGQFINGYHQLLGVPRPWSLWTDFLMISLTAAVNGWFCVWIRRRHFAAGSGG